jgi:hypothetical protein
MWPENSGQKRIAAGKLPLWVYVVAGLGLIFVIMVLVLSLT